MNPVLYIMLMIHPFKVVEAVFIEIINFQIRTKISHSRHLNQVILIYRGLMENLDNMEQKVAEDSL